MAYERWVVHSFSAVITPAKDLFLYLKNKTKYNDLDLDLMNLSHEVSIINSGMKYVDDILEIYPSKEKYGEYYILQKQIEVFHKKYTKFLSKYQIFCGNLPSLPEPKATTNVLTTVQKHIELPELDILTARNVIDDLQARKPAIFTRKFYNLAGFSKDVAELLYLSNLISKKITDKTYHLRNLIFEKIDDEMYHPSLDEYVKMVLRYLWKKENRIAIVGPVGVGKTAIMKNLNNHLENSNILIGYDIIIWVTYPTDLDAKDKIVGKIQDEIMTRLKLHKEKTHSTNQNAVIISTFLFNKRYILLMDQVASYIDLDEIGIFKHHNHGRVVIASSHVKVVNRMANEKVEIKTMAIHGKDSSSASIFEWGDEQVSENSAPFSNSAYISKLRREQRSEDKITDEITTVDEKTKISEIESYHSQAKITDQVTTVNEKTTIPSRLMLLEAARKEKMLFSASVFYPTHEGESSTCKETVQLEPETTFSMGAEEISVEQTGEMSKFMDWEAAQLEPETTFSTGAEEISVEQVEAEAEAEAVNLHSSRKLSLDDTSKGITISVTGEMSKFVDLNLILRTFSSQEMQRLLDSGLSYIDLVPKMEDYRFLVKKKFDHQSSGPLESVPVTTGALIPEHLILNKDICGTNEVAASDKWGHACVVNFIEENSASLPDNPNCPNLVLLFLQRNNRLSSIPSLFFQNMPALCFLDLSNTRIRTLPNSLFTLTRLEVLLLRNCAFLDELPSEISKLEHMEVLDLSGTELIDLPKEIVQLTRLRHLLLSFYGPDNESEYAHLPSELLCHGIISELKALQALSIVVHPEDHRWTTIASQIVEEVGKLKMLSYLQIYFPKVQDLDLFIERSPSWNEKVLTKYKFVVGNDVKRIVSRIPNGLESNYDQLDQCLRFVNGDEVNVIKKVVVHVKAFYLDHHVEIQSLSEFGISSFKDLRFLVVRECPKVEVIINEKISESVFPSLEHLSIHYLWELKHIWKSPVPPGSFCELKYLIVQMCPQLQFVLSESMLQCLFNLEEFVVEDCEAVTILIEEGKENVEHNAVKLPRLRKLVLHYLPQLLTLGIDIHLSDEQISVHGCPSLILNLTQKEKT